VAVLAPLILFLIIYMVYFAVMGNYPFSALFAQLPEGYTYAEYARRGFFELLFVAAINCCLFATVWIFAKRGENDHPFVLRVCSIILCVLTCRLIAIAFSKMALYVQSYGLTLLRFYTSYFMILLAFSFILLIVWSIRRFNVARPLIMVAIVAFLALQLVNPPALVANYNVDNYLAGNIKNIDMDELADYGSAANAALHRLNAEAPDADVREQADSLLSDHSRIFWLDEGEHMPWYAWNLSDWMGGYFQYTDDQ
jgi:hypothetical protein